MLDSSPHTVPDRYLSEAIPGIGGQLRQRPEDFLVEEIPAYTPCGSGEHIYMLVQKKDLSTLQMVKVIARHFGVRVGDVGYAGLKDKRAITRQVVSVHAPGKTPEDFPSLQHESIQVLWVDLHTNKLRRGHLNGNRFSIRVRGVPIQAALSAQRTLRLLERSGVPNRLGAQRFGGLLNNHLVGRAITLGNWSQALDELLGTQDRRDPAGLPDPHWQAETRAFYAQGRYREALARIPGGAEPERAALRALASGKSAHEAVMAIEPEARLFYLNALQSAVFNAVLDQRLADGTFDRLVEGDLAFKHENGSVFAVERAVLDDPGTPARLESLEISPSGPLWGASMLRAGGEVDRQEVTALRRFGLGPDDLAAAQRRDGLELRGVRRPLRAPLLYSEVEAGADDQGPYVRCAFELPAGAFATTVMDEVMKPSRAPAQAAPNPEQEP